MALIVRCENCANKQQNSLISFNTINLSNCSYSNLQADDSVSGIHFFAGRRPSRNRLGSTNSIQSIAGSMPRVNTVTNALKRFFSREDSARSPNNTPDGKCHLKCHLQTRCKKNKNNMFLCVFVGQPMPTLARSGSSASMTGMTGNKYQPPGTMRITDQVIEEVDEQMTIQSQRGHDTRPTAQSLFASYEDKEPTRSEPIDVPRSYNRAHSVAQPEHQTYMFPNNAIFSTSAPDEHTALRVQAPTINIEDSYDYEDGKKSEPNLKSAKHGTNGSMGDHQVVVKHYFFFQIS